MDVGAVADGRETMAGTRRSSRRSAKAEEAEEAEVEAEDEDKAREEGKGRAKSSGTRRSPSSAPRQRKKAAKESGGTKEAKSEGDEGVKRVAEGDAGDEKRSGDGVEAGKGRSPTKKKSPAKKPATERKAKATEPEDATPPPPPPPSATRRGKAKEPLPETPAPPATSTPTRGKDPVLVALVLALVVCCVAVLVMAWQRGDFAATVLGGGGGAGSTGAAPGARGVSRSRARPVRKAAGPAACYASMDKGVLRKVLDAESPAMAEWADGWVEDFVSDMGGRATGEYGKPMVLLLVHELGHGVGDEHKFNALQAWPKCHQAKCVLSMDGGLFANLPEAQHAGGEGEEEETDPVADLRGRLQGTILAKLLSEGGSCSGATGSVVALHNVERMHPKAVAALVSGLGDGGSYTHYGSRVSTGRTLFLLTAGVPSEVWQGGASEAGGGPMPWKARERRVRAHVEGLWATPEGEADTAVERALWSRIDYVAFRAPPPSEPENLLPLIPVLD